MKEQRNFSRLRCLLYAFVAAAMMPFSAEAQNQAVAPFGSPYAQNDDVLTVSQPGRLDIRPRGPSTALPPGTSLSATSPQLQRSVQPAAQPSAVFSAYEPVVPATLQETLQRKAEEMRTRPGAPHPSAAAAPTPVRRPAVPRENLGGLEEVFRLLEARKKPLEINLWFPGVTTLTNHEIAQGAAVVQGIALRVGNVPIVVTCNPAVQTGKFNVVVGLTGELGDFVQENDLKAEGNGHLLLKEIAYRRDTQLLVVTGRTPEGLDNAILSLGIARERLPGVTSAAIADIVLPKAPPFLRREPLREESVYTFLQLHEIGTGMEMLPNRRFRMEFILPGDFNPRYDGEMVLDLHFSHPVLEMRRAMSTDRVTVRMEHAPNESVTGEVVPVAGGGARAAVGVPARLLRIGANTLEITFPVSSSDGLQVYSDSTMALPPWRHSPTLPDLYIFSRTIYPWIGQPDGSEVFVYLAGGAMETVETAWTLMAKIAQVSNTVLYAAEYSVGGDLSQLNREAKHVIVVGDVDSIPETYRTGMPKDVFKELEEVFDPNPAQRGINLKDVLMMGAEKVKTNLSIDSPTPSVVKDIRAEAIIPTAERQQRGFLGAFPPKEHQHGWVLLLAAQTPELLRQRTVQLVMPEYWQNLKGGSVFWYNEPDSLRVYSSPTDTIKTVQSETNPNLFVEMPFGEKYPVKKWYIALAGFFLFMLLVLIKAVQRYASVRDYQ